jgi:hypothetical protein
LSLFPTCSEEHGIRIHLVFYFAAKAIDLLLHAECWANLEEKVPHYRQQSALRFFPYSVHATKLAYRVRVAQIAAASCSFAVDTLDASHLVFASLLLTAVS